MTTCRKCGRVLKNPVAILKGIGPVCERKEGYLVTSKKQYEGNNDVIIGYDGGDVFIERLDENGEKTTVSGCRTNIPLQNDTKSPTGYNFGYGGSGPACFAMNVCLLFFKHAADAYEHYQEFKSKFVAGHNEGDPNRLDIPRAAILSFMEERGIELREGI